MPTATRATHSVAKNSSTPPERNATRSPDMVLRLCSRPNSATRAAGACARLSARNVGRPAIRSSTCEFNVLIVLSLRSVRSRVISPMRIMNNGMSGSVMMMISADGQSASAITTTTVGVTSTVTINAGT
ncbi:Uncharacterised protein [Mycobacteroides abscessus subsp. abscessus]|nr:Uncharacterised protein [Mycobacteroides abscessus subsp. abscessus]